MDRRLMREWLGLVSSIHEPAQLVDEAVKMGNKIASYSKPIGKENFKGKYW